MDLKQRCILICGSDTYHSHKALRAIETRFLKQLNSFSDLAQFDLEETTLDTLRQSLLTVPFLIAHRLFILKNAFAATKATQEGLIRLLEQLTDSTIVVLYESKPCDKRLSFYTWLVKHARIEDYANPTGVKRLSFIAETARQAKVTIEPSAQSLLALAIPEDTEQLVHEIQKLACYALSQGRTIITLYDVQNLSHQESHESLFKLTDAIRDNDVRKSVELYRHFIEREDPMLLAGTIAGQFRSLAKIVLCQRQGIYRAEEIAKKTALNPYVVKLSLSFAQSITLPALKRSYAELIRYDSRVKDGTVPPDLGVLLLILRLHGTVKSRK